MSIQFSEIHNLVRTYLRVLKLEPVESAQPVAKGTDRVSISPRARELRRVTKAAQVSRESQAAEV